MRLFKHFSRKTAILFLGAMLAFGTFSCVEFFQPTPVLAEQPGDYPLPDQNPNDDVPTDSEGNVIEDQLAKWVYWLYSVKIHIFGHDIDFANLGGSLTEYLNLNGSLDDLNPDTMDNTGTTLYDIFKNKVYPVVQGMGVTLLTLMMLWKFIKECLEVERFSWERALMLIAKTIIANMFIMNSFYIIEIFYQWVMDALGAVVGTINSSQDITSIGSILATLIIEDGNPLTKIFTCIIAAIFAFMYYGTCVAVISQILVRYVKILVAITFSPIPMALSVDEQHGTDVLRYVFWMLGVFIQAPLIKIFLYIYNLVMSEACAVLVANNGAGDFMGLIGVLVSISLITGLLGMLISMAQQVTDKIVPA